MAANSLRVGLIFSLVVLGCSQTTTTEETSDEDQFITSSYILPKQIFNEGKPFYVDKDPISGQFDFSSKKPAGIEPEVNEVIDPKEKIVFSNSSPNIHDFLNLPVKYSSSKFVYPLVSSSYANLKYQGNNKNYISNHKNYTVAVTPPPNYFSSHRANVTKLHPASLPTTATRRPIGFVSSSTPKIVTKYKYGPTKKYTTSTTTVRTTLRPVPVTSSTTSPRPTTTSTTTARPTTTLATTPKPVPTTTQATTSTTRATPTTTNIPTRTIPSTTHKIPSTTTMFIAQPTDKPMFKPIPTITTFPTLDAAEVYNSVGQKKDPNTMSLEDIFNAFSDSDSDPYPTNAQGLDGNGNLMQPLSASKPEPFSYKPTTSRPVPNHSVQPTELVPQTIPEQNANNYVRYEVQQPNTNIVKYPAPSMNNIVISPDQNSATFVVGSQQSVGSSVFVGSADKEPMSENGQHIQYGTVINEQLPHLLQEHNGHTNAQQGPFNVHQGQKPIQHGQLPIHQGHASIQQSYPPVQQQGSIQTMQQQGVQSFQALPLSKPTVEEPQTQELYVSSNIRFPSETVVNGHGSPTVFEQHNKNGASNQGRQPPNPLVFPKTEYPPREGSNQFKDTGNHVVFQSDNYPNDKSEILTLNQQNLLNKNYPQLPEGLTPPNMPEQPRPIPQRPHHQPPPPPPPAFLYNEFTRKPLPGLHRPNPDHPLPNILPQFRPNAKISHGHSNYNREPGNIRVGHPNGPFPNRQQMALPPFAHRRTPIGNRYNKPMDNNRRVYKVPQPYPQMVDRMYIQKQHGPPPQAQRFIDGFPVERHVAASEQFFSPEPVQPERLPAFEEEDFLINDPPKPIVKKDIEIPSLEPVVTLQMLKTQKRTQYSAQNLAPVVSEEKPTLPQQTVPQNLQSSASGQSPVYVVYPVKSSPLQMDMISGPDEENGEPVVIGQRGDQPPVPPSDISTMSQGLDYQNTPFSVIRDQPQEPILIVKNKSQSQENVNFPYPLEKPDPAFAEFSKQQELHRFDRNTGVELSPRVVNRGSSIIAVSTDSPIAIAYTPTESNHYYPDQQLESHADKFSMPNLASQVIPEIRDSQTESTFHEELDNRGQHFEKDFMAPFYPSVSLTGVTNSHQQGWSIFTASTDQSMLDKNSINRVDNRDEGLPTTTPKFDPNRFQPEFQGGFKPIYPPDYKSPSDYDDEPREAVTQIFTTSTLAGLSSTSTTTAFTNSTTTTTTTTERPFLKERTKSKFETSIESLLFGDDESYGDSEDLDKLEDVSS